MNLLDMRRNPELFGNIWRCEKCCVEAWCSEFWFGTEYRNDVVGNVGGRT
jgi:hypothetical protein